MTSIVNNVVLDEPLQPRKPTKQEFIRDFVNSRLDEFIQAKMANQQEVKFEEVKEEEAKLGKKGEVLYQRIYWLDEA